MGNRCFFVTVKGLGSDCGPSGDYSQTIRNVTSVNFQRGTVPQGYPFAGCPYDYLVVDGVSAYPDFAGGSAAGYGTISEIDCGTGQPFPKYDCLNGTCVQKTQYNTPGLYPSLADCQAVCANGGACGSGKQCVDPTTFCPPGKVCIEQSEFSEIEGLISQINSEVC
ncbi:MAG: hypothetical protein V7K40_25905 [Nostoc sp.]|uniref:hypothetical protein n=1 Tax=Nostoc sp. TaxID=1180 RepID=UPI002FF46FC0